MEGAPEEYVARMLQVGEECARVLRDDGTLWLVIGDTWGAALPLSARATTPAWATRRSRTVPVPPPLKPCVCSHWWKPDPGPGLRALGARGGAVFCVWLWENEWEWLEAESEHATEFDPKERVFQPFEIVMSILHEERERRPSTARLREVVAASRQDRATRGEGRFGDDSRGTRRGIEHRCDDAAARAYSARMAPYQ